MTTQRQARLGSLAWTRGSRGAMTAQERKAFLTAAGTPPPRQAVGRLDLQDLNAPDSELARAAEQLSAGLPPALAAHGHRAWALGALLAARDGHSVDAEAFYVASLLHDAGLSTPTPGVCFTLTGADHVLAAARASADADADPDRADRAAEAITLHLNLGLDPARDPEAAYVQAGSLADLTGARLQHLPPDTLSRLSARHPRHQIRSEVTWRWAAEADAVPSGRAAALRELFIPLVEHAPIPA
jgi:hypothetical protein